MSESSSHVWDGVVGLQTVLSAIRQKEAALIGQMIETESMSEWLCDTWGQCWVGIAAEICHTWINAIGVECIWVGSPVEIRSTTVSSQVGDGVSNDVHLDASASGSSSCSVSNLDGPVDAWLVVWTVIRVLEEFDLHLNGFGLWNHLNCNSVNRAIAIGFVDTNELSVAARVDTVGR